MKKRLLLILSVLSVVFVLSACQGQNNDVKDSNVNKESNTENVESPENEAGENEGEKSDKKEEVKKKVKTEKSDKSKEEVKKKDEVKKSDKSKEKNEKEKKSETVAKKNSDKKVKEEKQEKKVEKKKEIKGESNKKDKAVKQEVTKKKKETKKVAPKGEPHSGEYMPVQALNIREGPGLAYNVIGYAATGQKLVATAKQVDEYDKNTTWYKVKTNGIEGWVGSGWTVKYSKAPKQSTNKNTSNNNSKGTNTSSNSNKGTNSSSGSGSTKYKANHIYFAGKAVPYKNGGQKNGQAIIDGLYYASTWGGASTFSGTDGLNTHFIGHNPGQFSGMHTSHTFIVTDSNGTPYTYKRTNYYLVNEYAVRVSDGKNMWDRIVGTGGGERITLQSTQKHPIKHIVEAQLVK